MKSHAIGLSFIWPCLSYSETCRLEFRVLQAYILHHIATPTQTAGVDYIVIGFILNLARTNEISNIA